jgi:hypothetical protein
VTNSTNTITDSGRADESRSPVAFPYALAATTIAFLCLGVWAPFPIFTDEIAFRQQDGRAVADHGVIYGIFEMCQSNIKTVPLVFEPVAWLLAQTMRILSPPEMRILSFAAVLAVVFTTVRQAVGNRNPAAGFLVLASFVGIAGYSLILVRNEFALELHLLSCLVAGGRLAKRRTGALGDLGVAIGLILGAALSVWSHTQGLLFLPLTSYLLARLAVRRFGSIGLLAGVAPFVLFVPPALKLDHFVCTEHPEIGAYIHELHFDTSDLGARHLAQLLFGGVHDYVARFLYAPNYRNRIFFFPVFDPANGVLKATDVLISVVVLSLGGLALCILAVAIFRFCKWCRFRGGSVALSEVFDKNQPFVISVLITIPVVFLFLYDPLHNSYRVHYLNHFLSVAACLALASLSGRVAIRVTKGACAIIGITVGASLILNAVLFAPPVLGGFESPMSLSIFRGWSQLSHDTDELARQCKMDLQRGRIIVDDFTQAGVFSRPVTIPVMYLVVQADRIKRPHAMSVYEEAVSLKANYAILRCPYFDILGVTPQGRTGEICCYTFN